MTRKLRYLPLCAMVILPAAAPAMADSATVIHGDAVVGVDELGRVLVTIEEKPLDGQVDYFFLFTSNERLSPPWWEHVDDAKIVWKAAGSLSLIGRHGQFAVNLAVDTAKPQKLPGRPDLEVFEDLNGVEMVAAPNPKDGILLSAHDHVWDDLESWPPMFWYDVLDPATQCQPDDDCQAGGIGSTACQVGGCSGIPESCQTSCGSGLYACCFCSVSIFNLGARCRCNSCPSP